MSKVITAQDRQDWEAHPVTKELLEQLRESKQETMEAWASEAFMGKTPADTAVFNAAALGGVRVLGELITQIELLQGSVVSGGDDE